MSWAFAIQSIALGLAAPGIGWLFDRFGPRPICVAGVTLSALSFVGLSHVHSSVAFDATFGLMGVGASAATFLLLNSVVSLWFKRRLGWALAMVQTGYGIGGVMAIAFVFMIERLGWRSAATLIGGFIFVLGVPMALVMRHRPENYGLLPDGMAAHRSRIGESVGSPRRSRPHEATSDLSVADALRTGAFWLILVVLTLSTAITMLVFTHQIRAMITYGITPEVAGVVAGGSALVGLVGRYGMGGLATFISSRYLLPAALTMQAAGVFALSQIHVGSLTGLLVFMILFGIGQGGIFLLSPLIQKEYFGTKAFGAIQGLLIGPSMIATAIAPVLVGGLVDTYGTYRPMFAAAGVLGVSLTVLMLFSPHPAAQIQLIGVERRQ